MTQPSFEPQRSNEARPGTPAQDYARAHVEVIRYRWRAGQLSFTEAVVGVWTYLEIFTFPDFDNTNFALWLMED